MNIDWTIYLQLSVASYTYTGTHLCTHTHTHIYTTVYYSV